MMTKIFSVALGILTAIGGFVDIGDLVTNAVVGSRFGMALAWVVVVGVIGICLYANMAGRVAAVSGRATFEIIRERLGPRTAAANLAASFFINLLTLTAEIGGVALALQLATDVGPMLWIPVAAFAVWLVIWRVKFSIMENVTGLLGLMLIVFAVSVFELHPNWGDLVHQVTAPAIPDKESAATYWYFAIALFGAAMTPYEVFFFSSGAVEEHWTTKDLGTARPTFRRLPARRHAVARDRGLRGDRAAAQSDRRDLAVAGGACPSSLPGASWRWRSLSSGSSPRRSAPHWRPRCPAATSWRSSSAGRGASSAGPPRPRASTS